MQKIIPFKKEMPFKNQVAEITSISLEHTLHKEGGNLITGLFIVSGDYKVVDTSNVIDHFSFELPFDIHMDDKYDLEKVHIDIDDFYYEIINNTSLMVNIDVLLDKIEEIEEEEVEELVREPKEEASLLESERLTDMDVVEELSPVISAPAKQEKIVEIEEDVDTTLLEEPKKVSAERKQEISDASIEPVSSIFDTFDQSVSASSVYKVYMVREEDSLESILSKYKTSREELEKYNNITEMKKGDKLIIPTVESEKN